METMIPPQVGMRLQTQKKRKKRGHKKREKPKKGEGPKNEKKGRRGTVTILLPHLCFKVAPCSSYRESLELSLSYTSGNFHYRTWLVYSWASKLDAHPLSFSLSFHILIALVHPLHGNTYSLTLISIDGHLHSPLIRLVDVRLSPFFILHITPTIILYSTYSAIPMAHAHVLRESWKSLRLLKYETIAWLVIGVVHN